jgi:hypothetical protein
MKKSILIVALISSFIALLPLSWRLADPFFTHPFSRDLHRKLPVLLIWPDHVEIRWFYDPSEISPRPSDAGYTFNIPPERQRWVQEQLRTTPAPNPKKAGWVLDVKQLGPQKQQIQLELLGDGIYGLIYEATPDKILPISTRLTGPGDAFVMLEIQIPLWCGLWLFIWAITRYRAARRSRIAIHRVNPSASSTEQAANR